MKIAICASEVVPFAKTGGLADVVGALSLALEKEGQDVVVVMPRYKEIDGTKFGLRKINPGASYCVIGGKIKVYFIENGKYFNRRGLYQEGNEDYKDNLERFACYCSRSLQLLKEIGFQPDIIHAHDWQASLIPVYLKALYSKDQFYKDTRTVLTVHNIGYQGIFPKDEFPKLGLDWKLFSLEGLEFYGKVNTLKGGLVFADIINTVSPTYAKEIRTKEFGFGLEGVLNKRSSSLFGILHGLDYKVWDPGNDRFIAANFSSLKPGGKAENKKDLQMLCSLPELKDVPLLGVVSRLVQHKGLDILCAAMEKICGMGVQVAILGTGDIKYHRILQRLAKKHPEAISLNLRFDDPLARKIYAGSDIFLMPSKYEPCGLGQLIALRYGSIPLVFKTGGLADTVSSDNGFVFNDYSASGLIKAVKRSQAAFSDKKKWGALILRAMNSDFSWGASTREYLKLYEKAKAS